MKISLQAPLHAKRRQDSTAGSCTIAEPIRHRLSNAAPQTSLARDIDHGPRTTHQRKNLAQLFGSPRSHMQTRNASQQGLPRPLQQGIEALSGLDMSDVRVHRNSSKPAQLNALAYAESNQIHLGPGQEKHLPHEAWHVVQQKKGLVRATRQLKGVQLNEDSSLEREAEVMGTKALRYQVSEAGAATMALQRSVISQVQPVVQRVRYRSKTSEMEVEVDVGDRGCIAQATGGHERSSLEFEVFRYRDQRKEDLQRTRAPIATQTGTMHAYPERAGIGTLLLYHTLSHFRERGIRYFQPDSMRSEGGNAMLELVGGGRLDGRQLAQIIAQAEGGGSSEGCWAAFKRIFCCCCPSSKPTEQTPLLPDPSVLPEPAYQIDNLGAAILLIGVKVGSKFRVL